MDGFCLVVKSRAICAAWRKSSRPRGFRLL
ncbi:YncE family protein, partial [Mycobacterium tuberculosis]